MTKEVPLNHGLVALIDDEDYERVMQHHWYADKGRTTFYARAYIPKYKKHIRLHRFIMNPKPEEEVDHIDHCGLNCHRHNMRNVTTAQNGRNKIKVIRSNTSSRFKGVMWRNDANSWRAKIGYNGKTFHLGYFKVEEDAARAYDEAAKKYFGEYACLNFPAGPP